MITPATTDAQPLPVIDAGEDDARMTLARTRLALMTWETNLRTTQRRIIAEAASDAAERLRLIGVQLDVIRDTLDVIGR